MSLTLFFIFILASYISIYFKFKRLTLASVVVAVLYFFSINSGLIPYILLKNLQPYTRSEQFQWKEKNLIIVLGAGVHQWPNRSDFTASVWGSSRLLEAERLYYQCKHQGRVCHILTSGGDPMKLGLAEAHVLKEQLIKSGVKEMDILVEDQSATTFQNAKYSAPIAMDYHHVLIATSGFHLKRSLSIFQHFGVKAAGAPSEYLMPQFKLLPSTQNFYFTDLALHEIGGMIKYTVWAHFDWDA